MERVMGIEPTSSAWKAEVLPLNYTRANPGDRGQHSAITITERQVSSDDCPPLFPAPLAGLGAAPAPGDPVRSTPCLHHPKMVEGVGFEPTKA